jgi:hypothetical protein
MVTDAPRDLVIGCGHGPFPRPMVRADRTFDAARLDPRRPTPARLSSVVSGSRLVRTVAPTARLDGDPAKENKTRIAVNRPLATWYQMVRMLVWLSRAT